MNAAPVDLTSLSWCLGEIRASLSRAEDALEAQLQAGADDLGRLREARGWLHQAHGALQVVDMEGVAAVTQEAEGLLDRCERGERALDAEAVRAAVRAFGAIVEFLEGVAAGSDDSAVCLFPHYRELLALRGAERIEPADLYSVDLGVRPPRAPTAEPLDAAGVARVRVAFERGLLGFLRNSDDAASLARLHAAIDRLYRANRASGDRTFWWLASAFFDALRARSLPADLYSKRLVARINLQIRRTLQQGTPIADRMLRDLLFMLARAGGGSPLADEARALFRLAGTVPADFETPRYGVVDARWLRAAREATTAAKLAWEKAARGGAHDLPAFATAAQALDAAFSRLPWPGLQRLSGVLLGLRRALAAAGPALAEVLSLEVATALLFVDNALERGARGVAQHDRRAAEMAERIQGLCERQESDGAPMPEWLTELSRAAQDRMTVSAFVGELQANLRACEKALDAFFRDPAQRAALPPLEPLLRQVGGALRLLGHAEAADGADAVAGQVVAFAGTDEPPAQADCERVAGSLGALGFFVESLLRADRRGGFEFGRAGDAFVARLGEPAAARSAPPPEIDAATVAAPSGADPLQSPRDADEPARDGSSVEPVVAVGQADEEGPSLERLLAQRRARLRGQLAALQAHPDEAPAREALHAALVAVRDESMLLDDAHLRARAAEALGLLDAGVAAQDAGLAEAVMRVAEDPVVAVPVVAEVPSDAAAIDDELLGIFLDEADEVLEAIAATREASIAAPSDVPLLTTLRRGFHTLKGSSRMVGLAPFGEAAWGMEQVLNGLLADERPGTPGLYEGIARAHATMSEWVARLRDDPGFPIDPAALVAGAAALSEGRPWPAGMPADRAGGTVPEAPEAGPEGTLAPEPGLPDPPETDPAVPVGDAAGSIPDDDLPLIDLGAVEPGVSPTGWGEDVIELAEALDPIELEVPVLSPLDEIEATAIGEPAGPDALDALEGVEVVELVELVDAPAFAEEADAAPFEHRLEVAPPAAPAPLDAPPAAGVVRVGERTLPEALYRIFLNESDRLLAVLDATHARWRADPSEPADEPCTRAAHTLRGSSRLVGLDSVSAAADALERFMSARPVPGAPLQPVDLDDLAHVLERIRDALGRFAAGEDPGEDPSMTERAEALATRGPLARAMPDDVPHDDAMPDGTMPDGAPVADAPVADAPVARVSPVAPVAHDAEAAQRPGDAVARADAPAGGEPLEGLAALVDDIDPELGPVFVEEADELLPRIGDALRAWHERPDDASGPEALMRLLHTVKGSARMAGAMRLGQLVHDMETRIEAAVALPQVPGALVDDLVARNDQVLALYEAIRDPGSESAQAAARAVIEALSGARPPGAGDASGEDGEPGRSAARAGTESAGSAARSAAAGVPEKSQQLIRVRADLLDRLVNEAGEVSIARARLENELGGIRQSLGELAENVNRLRSQLREIELAADSQIQARTARNRDLDTEFDPLEFDRYTRFQELTRMLAESVSDVSTVQINALRSLDEAHRDLARQTQVTRDLQQDLMRIRMVHFGSIADRLYRVVRQAAKELDKRVNLDLDGAGAELDRGVLERMAGPIEHLLRNAVAHGIETRAQRAAAGKPETGEITLEVRQEGNEVILTFADDGAGLNFDRIRERAIERGLLAPDARPGRRELGELIFMPGFSTATAVTAIAGRGVGMDVVRAEVAAMGGRIELDSEPGRGTRFAVFLPVSLAVAQVVLVSVGTARIAIASALIEQVLQLKPEALAAAYAQHQVDWQGEAVPLYFLGSLLELRECTPLAQRYSPVMIVRSGNARIALHVDLVSPSQEVVVKHVGPQLARLTGMAGATVLGNGEIVLILNPVQIAATGRGAQAGQGDTATFAPTRIEIAPTVMVVDDSVTVRKVTQRLLVREGYQVMLAKDGLDALRQLQDGVPDVMLLDIEMPRMDGFELTKKVRADDRLKHLPIVMVTSRTADKHRNHAMALGVDAFLGKPFDEDELLGQVKTLAARRLAAG
jgi:chemosensory pili system protein ChpA (sensor histidine kinase/response regulator)